MNEVEILFDNGLHLPALDLWLDAHLPRARAFVSHGHADHIEAPVAGCRG
jgi:phosphoribosyl 1,2-cyclic phosphodiesterase